MSNCVAIDDRKGSTLSLVVLLGGAVAGLSSVAVGMPGRNWPKPTEGVLKSVWSNYADSTHTLAFGLPIAARLPPLLVTEASLNQVFEALEVSWSPAGDLESWARHVLDPAASTDVDVLTETAESAFDFIASFGAGSVDLSNLNAHQVNGEHLATLLRALSTWRDEIPGWEKALEVNILALQNAGIDPKEALYGMT